MSGDILTISKITPAASKKNDERGYWSDEADPSVCLLLTVAFDLKSGPLKKEREGTGRIRRKV